MPDISFLLERDPLMKDHEKEVRTRYGDYQDCLLRMGQEGGLEKFTMGYKLFGPQVCTEQYYRLTVLSCAALG